MYTAALSFLALVGCVVASPDYLFPFASAYADGQWHPELDGSIAGSGLLRYGLDDGQWKPELDGSWQGRGDLTWLNRKKRDLHAVNPYSLPTPLDEPINAIAKNAHLIQYNTEATRNILGGGIPIDLPADTPVVSDLKKAHAIAHENQKLATTGIYAPRAIGISTPGYPLAARAVPIHQYGYRALPYRGLNSYYNYGLGYSHIY